MEDLNTVGMNSHIQSLEKIENISSLPQTTSHPRMMVNISHQESKNDMLSKEPAF